MVRAAEALDSLGVRRTMTIDQGASRIKPLKLPFALRRGQIVHISEVQPGSESSFTCPGCGSPVIARNGRLKRHHFSHSAASTCSESATHFVGKHLMFECLRTAIATKATIVVRWSCKRCYGVHERSLLRKAMRVVLEEKVGPFQPDLALYDADNKPIAAIEIIVSHAPEEGSRAFYESAKVGLIEYAIRDDADLERLREFTTLEASAVSVCLSPKCEKCRSRRKVSRDFHVVNILCQNPSCRRPMNVGFTCCGQMSYPRNLSDDEAAVLARFGVSFGSYYNSSFRSKSRTCLCTHCGRSPNENLYRGDYWYKADEKTVVFSDEVCAKCFDLEDDIA